MMPPRNRLSRHFTEVLLEKRLTREDVTEHLGCTSWKLSNIVSGQRRLSAAMALKFEELLGVPAIVWLIHQAWDEIDKAEGKK